MALLDFYEARQHEPITKKNGGRVTTLPSSHTPTRREEKKMAGTVGCPRRRQNTNTQVSDNSSRNHTHTHKKKMRPKMQLTVVLRHGKSKSNYSRFPDEPPCKARDAAKESVFADQIQYRDDDRSRRGAHGKWGDTIVGGR